MPGTLQSFLARAIPKAVADLEEALLRLPEDKRSWAPAETSRSAMNQVAEVAILNGNVADTITNRSFPADFSMDEYMRLAKAYESDWSALKTTLEANSERAVSAILGVGDDELTIEIDTPFARLSLEQMVSYPYWNTCYHEGQINYIASILGCLN